MRKRILTGITTTGTPHIGNYLGAIKPALELAGSENDSYFFLADYHALIKQTNPTEIEKSVKNVALAWLSSGLDPEESHFYRQSDVPEVHELTWILNCSAAKGLLNRAHAYKAVVSENLELGSDDDKAINMGLFSYPVLMAADILLYDATHVPVGDDQKQHLELCRDIAQKFNNDFNRPGFLNAPEPLIQKQFSRIMSLKDGLKKMSKSDPSDLSRINLTDSKDEIVNKIKKAKTDPLPLPKNIDELVERPEAENLLGIYSSLKNQSLQNSIDEFSGKNFSEFKIELSDVLVEKIEPISKKIKELLNDEKYLDTILLEGSKKADIVASKKIKEIKELVGF